MARGSAVTPKHAHSGLESEERPHLFGHNPCFEAVFQLLLALLAAGGGAMVVTAVQDDPAFTSSEKDTLYFLFSSGVLLCVLLLFDASSNIPTMSALMLAIGYFWFPEAISQVELWNRNPSDYKDSDLLVSGGCLALVASALSTVFEGSIPGFSEGCKPSMLCALALSVVGVAGLITTWNYIDMVDPDAAAADADTDPVTMAVSSSSELTADEYREMVKFSTKAFLSIIMLGDSCVHNDLIINVVAIFMGMNTFCEFAKFSLRFVDARDDARMAYGGCLVTSASIGVMNLLVVIFSKFNYDNKVTAIRYGLKNRKNSK